MQIDTFDVKSFPGIDVLGLEDDSHPVRICIATEEIIGPVRNGGIASTYYHLAKGLASRGHEVHVLYLKGPVVENETPDHWVAHFAEIGVTLHYLDIPAAPIWGPSQHWQPRYLAAYQWLRDQPAFDIVHTSEWRGGMVYALMAKSLGLAFDETLFIVKTSSPHIWNRHYQMQPIERVDLVAASYAEQKCVELADMVVGGSAHLITFMEEIGYKVPQANVFVQPNIVDFSEVKVTDLREPREAGDVVRTRELVFFGRLEARKGIELFCNALDSLMDRGIHPEKVTFLGKFGVPLTKFGGIKVADYIAQRSQDWPFEVDVIPDLNQPEALSFICNSDKVAVMPSLIENSTMAVYETLEMKIPFLATRVGGTFELIAEEDRDACLVEPTSQSLAAGIERVLRDGQKIARPSFSNARNLEVWYGFHNHVGKRIAKEGRRDAIRGLLGTTPATDDAGRVAYVALARDAASLDAAVRSITEDSPDEAVIACTDFRLAKSAEAAVRELADKGHPVRLLRSIGQAAGEALNTAVSRTAAEVVIVAAGTAASLRPGFAAAARTGLAHAPGALFTTRFTDSHDLSGLPLGGDVASQYLTSAAYGPEIVALRRDRLKQLGAFEPYDVEYGLVQEYVTRSQERDGQDMLVYAEPLLFWPAVQAETEAFSKDPVAKYLKAKPLLDTSSIGLRKILLSTLGQGGGTGLGDLSGVKSQDGKPVWLTPLDRMETDGSVERLRDLVLAIDEDSTDIYLLAKGWGRRELLVSDKPVPTDAVDRTLLPECTLRRFPVPEDWIAGASYELKWTVETPEGPKRLPFQITKFADGILALTTRQPIMTWEALRAALDRRAEEKRQFLRPVVPVSQDAEDVQQMELQRVADRSGDILGRGAPAETNGAAPRRVRSAIVDRTRSDWSEGWLIGWAWDREDTGALLNVALVQNGRPVVAVPADAHIPSLGRRTPDLEFHGFRLPLSAEILKEEGEARLVVLETGEEVPGARFSVTRGTPGRMTVTRISS
ncbi:glycosyltransferase family 4 protein [Sulfitobacter sp. D35]|uniref:glycosyltransferase family 4 protein n=1 Tax=Sulfitobacter sp. D35 TaxID=3083252 RepID=UPI0029700756|nr:glycosyltransferase family 4 protein [Sulfitobacter sp. D35]MDW4500065.1 glycosyltransferase family 4 protein [Sulfitobacter sp. D35]